MAILVQHPANGCTRRAGALNAIQQPLDFAPAVFGVGDRAAARATDPDTSHKAAESVSREAIRRTQMCVLRVLEQIGSGTDEDIADAWPDEPFSPSGARTRRAELVARGLVEWAGMSKKLRSGRRGRVWRLARAAF